MLSSVSAIASKMGIEEAHDKQIEELSKDTHPGNVWIRWQKLPGRKRREFPKWLFELKNAGVGRLH